MKTFIIPVDFSASSQNALQYAVYLAQQMQVKTISLFHAYHMPVIEGVEDYRKLDEATNAIKLGKINRMKEFVQQTLGHLPQNANIEFNFVAKEGDIADQLMQLTDNKQFIVMGTQGKPHADTDTGGSHTSDVMLKLNAPVLAIPAGMAYKNPQKIVYAIDYEKYDHAVLYSLKAFADAFDAEITLLHINPTQGYFDEVHMDNYRKTIREIMEYENMNLDFITGEDLEKVLQIYINEKHPDLLVMLSRKGTIRYNKYKSSFSRQMVMNAHLPVLIFHQQ